MIRTSIIITHCPVLQDWRDTGCDVSQVCFLLKLSWPFEGIFSSSSGSKAPRPPRTLPSAPCGCKWFWICSSLFFRFSIHWKLFWLILNYWWFESWKGSPRLLEIWRYFTGCMMEKYYSCMQYSYCFLNLNCVLS